MAKPRRLTKKVLLEDLETYASLQAITGYTPSDAAFSLANITTSHGKMSGSQTTEAQKFDEYESARDIATDDERDFHNKILGAKTQIKAQFGENSNEFQSMGMKKKEEYKVGRRTKTEPKP